MRGRPFNHKLDHTKKETKELIPAYDWAARIRGFTAHAHASFGWESKFLYFLFIDDISHPN